MLFKITSTVLFLALLSGCSISAIVKDCQPVAGGSQFVCKTLKPWE